MNKLFKVVVALIATTITCVTVSAGEPLVKGVNSYSNATIADLQKVTKGTGLYGYEQVILDTEKEFQVNAFFILAVAQAETSLGTAGTGVSKNNAFGLTKRGGGYATYNNIGESIKAFGGNIKRVHFNNGRYTIPAIARVYCPPNAAQWSTKVVNNINSLYDKMTR